MATHIEHCHGEGPQKSHFKAEPKFYHNPCDFIYATLSAIVQESSLFNCAANVWSKVFFQQPVNAGCLETWNNEAIKRLHKEYCKLIQY